MSRVTSVITLAVFLLAAVTLSSPAASAQSASHFVVSRVSSTTYQAVEQNMGITYAGRLKSVVESAVADLDAAGGGLVTFQSGDFDLGSDYFRLRNVDDVSFEGQGIDVTVIRNFSSVQADTEVFNLGRANRVEIRDLTVFAGGPFRSTSDAIDCDTCDDSLIERVKVSGSRARGIIFDGKDNVGDGDAVRNTVRNCIVVGVPSDGIELLASSQNTVYGCSILGVAGNGIQITKSSGSASQPNKKSSDNIVSGNYIENSGKDGINIIGSDRNRVIGNTILNSSDAVSSRDGIRIESSNGITCDDNLIDQNMATDTQATKTQSYGLNIRDPECHRTVVGTNDFTGNRVGAINDRGTDTRYMPPATPTPTSTSTFTPTGLPSPSPSPTPTATAEWTAAPTASPVPTATLIGTPGGETFSFAPVADAYVLAVKPTSNTGSSLSLRADGSPDMRSYLRFEVQGVTGAVVQARLRLYANSSHNVGYDARGVADNSWGESTITYNNAPAVGSVAASSGGFSAGTWTEVDVTALVSGNGTFSLVLTTTSSTGMNLASRETGATAPQLMIEALPAAPTATPPVSASHTPTAVPTNTSIATVTATATPTGTATSTPTSLPSPTPSPSPSPLPTSTSGGEATPSASPMPTATPTGVPGGGTFSFVPVADAYVNAVKPGGNAGSSLSLRADGSPEMLSYLRFNVQGLAGAVVQARLRLFANSSHSQGYDVCGVAENGWGEDTITYDNAPAVGSVVASSGGFSADTWTEVDVTALVSGDGTVSLAFTTGSSTGMNLASRETGDTAPRLIIETQ